MILNNVLLRVEVGINTDTSSIKVKKLRATVKTAIKSEIKKNYNSDVNLEVDLTIDKLDSQIIQVVVQDTIDNLNEHELNVLAMVIGQCLMFISDVRQYMCTVMMDEGQVSGRWAAIITGQ